MIPPKVVVSGIGYMAFSLTNLVLLYLLIASPPIHWWYDVIPPAGASSVYVPGSGFSGFWFHLGALQAIPNLHDYDFYCYSSGCLSVVMAAMNVSVTDALSMTYDIQQKWLAGDMSRFEIVDAFLEDVLGNNDIDPLDAMNDIAVVDNDDRIESFLANIHVLVTTKGNGVKVVNPTSRRELVDALKQTTWIPFVTGEGVLRPTLDELNSGNLTTIGDGADDDDGIMRLDEQDFYLDGGFSRMLHPLCEFDLRVPNTWINILYTLNPALKPHHVDELWEAGRNFDHPLLAYR